MKNLYHLRNTKKSWIVYAIGIFLFCSVCLAFKNFNDKMTLMGDSVHRYQQMIDKQSEQLSDVTKENERYKRDLQHAKELHSGNMKEMELRFSSLQDDCKAETTRLENEVGDIQDNYTNLSEENRKLENKYKTLSKANSGAISDVENYKQENKKLRAQLHDATTSKSSELLDLRDKLEKMTQERERFKDQYEALFKQHQQSFDNIQVLQTERDKLQDQIREIRKLSHGGAGGGDAKSSLAPADQVQAQPDSPNVGAALSSSTQRALSPVNQVVEEPAPVPAVSSSTSSSAQVLGGGQAAAAAPPLDPEADVQSVIDAAASLVRYPPVMKAKPAQARRVDQQQQYLRPLQPVQHHQQQDDDDFDVLNAPQHYPQSEFKSGNGRQQIQQQWYPGGEGYGRQQYRNINLQQPQERQILPQVGKYGGVQQLQQPPQGQIVHHGDHYHLQQQSEDLQPRYKRQKQQQQSYQDSWNSYNNEIQDFYRGNVRRDF